MLVFFASTAHAQARGQNQTVWHTFERDRSVTLHVATTDGRDVTTTFPPYTEVIALELSPNREHAYLRYRRTERVSEHRWWPRGARRLKVVRVADGQELVDFAPGFGGEFRWFGSERILHTWGCGSNCQPYAVYDLHGNEVTGGVSQWGFELLFQNADYIAEVGRSDTDAGSCRLMVHDFVHNRSRDYRNIVCRDYTRLSQRGAFLIAQGGGHASRVPLAPDSAWTAFQPRRVDEGR